MSDKVISVAVFVFVYAALITKRMKPWAAVWLGVLLLVGFGVISTEEALSSINLNVIGVFIGAATLSSLFVASKAPACMAAALIRRWPTPSAAMLSVCVLSGLISSVVDNVATVLMVVPIAFEMSRRFKISPTKFVVAIAISANLQGTATLVGDATSMLLAAANQMTFLDFFWHLGHPGVFFAVQAAAVASFFILWKMFRGSADQSRSMEAEGSGESSETRESVKSVESAGSAGSAGIVDSSGSEECSDFAKSSDVISWVPTSLMGLMVGIMAAASLFPGYPEWGPGAVAMVLAFVGLVWDVFWRGPVSDAVHPLSSIQWETALFLCGLFVVTGSLSATGLIEDVASGFLKLGKDNLPLAYAALVWVSVLVSAFVDNIPYTMAMLPVARLVAAGCGISPHLFMYGLMLGTTAGGNITPFGASANIVAVSALDKEGYDVSPREFASVGLPFTLAAVLVGSLFNWVVWR